MDGKDHGSPAGHAEGTVSDVVNLSAIELSRAIEKRAVSCVAVMQAYLSRIDAVNPRHNAIVSLRDHGELLAEAEQRDKAWAALWRLQPSIIPWKNCGKHGSPCVTG